MFFLFNDISYLYNFESFFVEPHGRDSYVVKGISSHSDGLGSVIADCSNRQSAEIIKDMANALIDNK